MSGLFLYAFPSATLGYFAIVLLHVALGVLLFFLLLPFLARLVRTEMLAARFGWVLLACGALLGVTLIYFGTPHRLRGLLYAHVLLSAAGAVLLTASSMTSRRWLGSGASGHLLRLVMLVVATATVAGGAWWSREVAWKNRYRILNPTMPPATMDGEGDGPRGSFFPSSAQTKHGGYIPAKYFMQSDACRRCHEDIYEQWYSSAHHFSSFNNQWYRKSVEYMQDVAGVRPSKWCAGCHDPALLFSGMFDTSIKEIVDRREAKAGLSCLVCHSIVQVKSTMGQGDYILEYPKLHELAASEHPLVRMVHDFIVRLNPEPHRRTFLKPFMHAQTAEFCSSCHKVHLDVPVNSYRWVRGFNEYDNWQASGVSGQGARSFYYPPGPQQCADCHMPLVRSKDEGNDGGYVHSHRFPGANLALPVVNADTAQLDITQKFLKDGNLSVDIFAISPCLKERASSEVSRADFTTTFAVGEEAEVSRAVGPSGEPRVITAPLGRVDAAVRRGDDVLIDVVVRTRKVGHFFPGGTVDAFDVWLELLATDERKQTLFWSGMVEEGGKGPVEKGAHFYRSLQVDAHGNPINKRNAWATRSVVYVRLIPPGAADTVHYRLHVPANAGDIITLRAKLNYRKFAWWNTQFSFGGVRDPSDPHPDVTKNYDDGRWLLNGNISHVSRNLTNIPDLPILTVAEDTKTLRVLPPTASAPTPQVALSNVDWTRWNDYGIGLLLQGDLKGSEQAFEKITEMDPKNPDGWVNLGRVRVQEGDMEGARPVLERALALQPNLARAHYFYARVLKAQGRYEEALGQLRIVLAQFPRDRVVRNEVGRILFLQKHYVEAIQEFNQVLAVDPEDLQANYNLMLSYSGLGQENRANDYKARYIRFKADESAEAITGSYRRSHPEDNNERQAIHEHVSGPLSPSGKEGLAAGRMAAVPKGYRVVAK